MQAVASSTRITGLQIARASPARTGSQPGRRSVVRCAAAGADAGQTAPRPSWLPGSTLPKHLDGTLAGDNGFDPLNLGEDSEALRWYVQAELVHCRWAMLGVAGMLLTDVLRTTGVSPSIPVWFEAGAADYGIPTPTLVAIQFLLFNFVEIKRWMDFKAPGSQGKYQEAFFFWVEPALAGTANGYPGGPLFDPLNFAENINSAPARKLKEQEIANGRLAMLAALGFFVQAKVTGQGPFENLLTHLADPWHTTVIDRLFP